MTPRELAGLVFLVAGFVLMLAGGAVSHRIQAASFLLSVAGCWLFYTKRMARRKERQEREEPDNPSPVEDIHVHARQRARGGGMPDAGFSGDGDGD